MKETTLPLISCLCVTNNRVPFLKRAVDCFLSQTYSNKELIIVYGEDDISTAAYVDLIEDENIKGVQYRSTPGFTLGDQRNLSIQASKGEYFCQWDDDDWYHNQRLEVQLEEAVNNGKEASVLVYKLMFDSINGNGFLSKIGPWPNTILCKKSVVEGSISYPQINKKEDEEFVMRLYGKKCVYPIIKPTMYIYVYHGSNTWDLKHFDMLFSKSQPLSNTTSKRISQVLNNDVSNSEASEILLSNHFLEELNYFYN